ncbi:MAG: MATE family efflux transporter [Firmicutes bacterium]|nr:MATE family efflux transporter [Bacillota bacterium]
MMLKQSLIGDRQFYRNVFSVALPLLIQNVITTFVSLLDNIMVGRIGTEPMSGVAISNQLLFVVNLGLFGMISGIGIFTSQYHGKGDDEGVCKTFRIKLVCAAVFIGAAIIILSIFGDRLIWTYLHEGESGVDLQTVYGYGKAYLSRVMLGLPFFGLSQIYAGTLRETKQGTVPMAAGVTAVMLNLVFNYILIYGKLGFPAMGVIGAAAATNISRVAEFSINMIWAHTHKDRAVFAKSVFGRHHISAAMLGKVLLTAAPLFLNEFLWSAGQTVLNQIYSQKGIEVVPAINISGAAVNLFMTFYLAMGNALSIIVGHALGRDAKEEAVDTDNKLIFMTTVSTLIIAVITFLSADVIVNIYNTSAEVKALASSFIRISAVLMPIDATVICYYFTLRCGGKTFITFLFDSCFSWVVSIPLAWVLLHYTELNILMMYAAVVSATVLKLIVGMILVKKKLWVNNLVED